MQQLEEKIGYHFQNLGLLETALTHSSYVNEHPREHPECYERLELSTRGSIRSVMSGWNSLGTPSSGW